MHGSLAELGLILGAAAAGYAVLAALATLLALARSRRPAPLAAPTAPAGPVLPAVTVLKPLCGNEPQLYERLCSICAQDYPRFQIIFGLHGPADGALPIARRVQRQFDALDIECVIDPTRHGVNAKVSNLLNMLPHARHELLVIADSDIEVTPDFLRRVLAPLDDPRVGLVTCGYAGQPLPGWCSALGAQFINAWFMPSVYLAAMFGSQWFVSGATMALRRELLTRGGGLERLADRLAEDFLLGAQVRGQGQNVVLSELQVQTLVDEPSLEALCRHSLRWLRTIKSVRLWAYAGCLFTFSLPLAALGASLARFQPGAMRLFAVTIASRLVLHFVGQRDGARRGWRQLGLIPLHDALLLALWLWGFGGREVSWRHERFGIGRHGALYRVP